MAGRTIAKHMFKQLIQHFSQSVAIKEASRRLGLSRNTVRRYYRQLQQSSTDLRELMQREEPELQAWFNPPVETDVDRERYEDLVSRVPGILGQLGKTGVTKLLLWEEYQAEVPHGYSYSQFCHWLGVLGAPHRASMVQDVPAGEAVYIDFAGRTMEIIDPQSGQVQSRQLFVATAGYSYLTYVEAIPTQRSSDFIAALDRAIHFFGGSPRTIVCDNFKAAVVRADRYEPTIHQVLADLAAHYGTTITPARVARPQDKSRVELSVRYVYLRVIGPLRRRQFFSDHELNSAIREQMQIANDRPMQRYGVSRSHRFECDERSTLAALPAQPFEFTYRRQLKAQKNNHVYLAQDRTYYSLPFTCIGSTVEVIYTATLVKIFHQGQCVAVHQRTYVPNTYVTRTEHMPAAHQAMRNRHTQQYLSWAASTNSTAVVALMQRLLNSRQYPQQAYRSCDGIRSLYRRYGGEALDNACSTALELDQCNYGFLNNHLRSQASAPAPARLAETTEAGSTPHHDNIRGATYYA